MVKYLFAAIAAMILLSACNTMRGVGQDVSHAGHEIQEGAQRHR